ncbi:MAG: hypothetical protein KJ077_02000 [Anaerolineae bacterium]|jgi:hypothetical protein|nr:hypothetical protein [Anaerolineae bacterium]GIK37083.1 MAG: hypothetical protein BroJett011_09160 [Chloroflexota bacterium]
MLTFIRRLGQVVIDFCYTSSVYSMSRELRQQQAELETVLMVLILGDDLGVPVFPSFYGRRLWPYLLRRMASWKRNLLRPKGPGSW